MTLLDDVEFSRILADRYFKLALEGRDSVQGMSIDGRGTRNIDDAFVAQLRPDGTMAVTVHIADAPAMIEPGTEIDRHARDRVADFLVGGNGQRKQKIMGMLPERLVMNYLSLQKDEVRPAITMKIVMDKDGNVTDFSCRRTKFENKIKTNYDDVNAKISNGHAIYSNMHEVAKRLYAKRMHDLGEYFEDRMSRDALAPVTAVPRAECSPADFLVAEVMSLVKRTVADFMRNEGLPYIKAPHAVRVHDEVVSCSRNSSLPVLAAQRNAAIVKKIESEMTFAQATSPNRSYSDLVNLRTLMEHLEGKPLSHDPAEIQEIEAQCNRVGRIFNAASGATCENASHIAGHVIKGDMERAETMAKVAFDAGSRPAHGRIPGEGFKELREQCRDARVQEPECVVQSVYYGGSKVCCASIAVQGAKGGRRVVHAVGSSVSDATDRASFLMLSDLEKNNVAFTARPVGHLGL